MHGDICSCPVPTNLLLSCGRARELDSDSDSKEGGMRGGSGSQSKEGGGSDSNALHSEDMGLSLLSLPGQLLKESLHANWSGPSMLQFYMDHC